MTSFYQPAAPARGHPAAYAAGSPSRACGKMKKGARLIGERPLYDKRSPSTESGGRVVSGNSQGGGIQDEFILAQQRPRVDDPTARRSGNLSQSAQFPEISRARIGQRIGYIGRRRPKLAAFRRFSERLNLPICR